MTDYANLSCLRKVSSYCTLLGQHVETRLCDACFTESQRVSPSSLRETSVLRMLSSLSEIDDDTVHRQRLAMDEKFADPCIHRSDQPIDRADCNCVHKHIFSCSSAARGIPTCKVSDCAVCEHYE